MAHKQVNLQEVLGHPRGRTPGGGVLGQLERTYLQGGPWTQNTLPRLPRLGIPSWLDMQLASVPTGEGKVRMNSNRTPGSAEARR